MSHNVKAPFSRFYPIFDGIFIFNYFFILFFSAFGDSDINKNHRGGGDGEFQ